MTIISKELDEVLEEHRIRKQDALLYLLGLYYSIPTPDYVPSTLRAKVHAAGIVEFWKGELIWHINLFSSKIGDADFQKLLIDYRACFSAFDREHLYKREVSDRMRAFLSQFPDVTPDEIVAATKAYVQDCIFLHKEAQYVKLPHYFIEKGRGKDRTRPLLTWIEKLRVEGFDNTEDDTIRMQ